MKTKLPEEEVNQFLEMYDRADKFLENLKNNPNLQLETKHKTNLTYYFKNNRERFFEELYRYIKYDMQIMTGKTTDVVLRTHEQCRCCTKHIDYIINGDVIKPIVDHEECFDAKPFSFEIDVPSGILLIEDWLEYGSQILKPLEDGKKIGSICTLQGRLEMSTLYASHNIMHVEVGNTCPSIFQKGNLIYIGYDGEQKKLLPYAKNVGSVCTDLWWTTAIDADLYKKMMVEKLGEEDIDKKMKEVLDKSNVVKVKPGVYKYTHYYGLVEQKKHEPELFTTIEFVREINGGLVNE